MKKYRYKSVAASIQYHLGFEHIPDSESELGRF